MSKHNPHLWNADTKSWHEFWSTPRRWKLHPPKSQRNRPQLQKRLNSYLLKDFTGFSVISCNHSVIIFLQSADWRKMLLHCNFQKMSYNFESLLSTNFLFRSVFLEKACTAFYYLPSVWIFTVLQWMHWELYIKGHATITKEAEQLRFYFSGDSLRSW